MIGWLLDTNVVASLSAPDGAPSVKSWAAAQDERNLYLSVLTLGEYDKGIALLDDNDPRRAQFIFLRNAIAARFGGRILSVSDRIVERWGALAGRIRRNHGHPPPVIDTMFAATALEEQLYFVTRNGKDVAHTGVIVFDPWTDAVDKFPFLPRRSPR